MFLKNQAHAHCLNQSINRIARQRGLSSQERSQDVPFDVRALYQLREQHSPTIGAVDRAAKLPAESGLSGCLFHPPQVFLDLRPLGFNSCRTLALGGTLLVRQDFYVGLHDSSPCRG